MEIGLITAFAGGILALLSPCGALLLPAFFASTLGSGPRLWLHGGVFYAGLLSLLVPLGIGVGAVGSLFVQHRSTIILATAIILILLGLAQMAGLGFDPARLVPGASTLQAKAHANAGLAKTFLLGAASGIAGFCAGPILGAVLTVAAAQGNAVTAGVLLAAYAAGMVVPLLLLAALWHRIGSRVRRLLQGRHFTVFGRQLHSTSVIAGALIFSVGVLFWATNGLATLPQILPSSFSDWLQRSSALLANPIVEVAAIALAAGLIVWWWLRRTSKTEAETASEPEARP